MDRIDRSFSFHQIEGIPIYSGAGSCDMLISILTKLPYQRLCILVSHTIQSSEKYQKMIQQLPYFYVEYHQIHKDPDEMTILQATALCKKHDCDIVIAIGGGSVMDCAKGVSLMAVNDGSLMDYLHDKNYQIDSMLPLICMPTTIGTGSEISRNLVVMDAKTRKKKRIIDDKIRSDMVILDPEFLQSLSKPLIAAGGMDMLAHAIEGYTNRLSMISPDANIDQYALLSLRLIHRSLLSVYHDSASLHEWTQLQWAGLFAGLAMERDLNANHPYAGVLHEMFPALYHGEAVGMMLPVVMKLNECACIERYHQIAEIFQLSSGTECVSLIRRYQKAMGISELKDIIPSKEAYDSLIQSISTLDVSTYNPVSITKDAIDWVITSWMK